MEKVKAQPHEKESKLSPIPPARAAAVLVAALAPASNRPANAFLQSEYAAENNVSEGTAKRAIRKLAAAGKIRQVKFHIQKSNGYWQQTMGWEIVTGGGK